MAILQTILLALVVFVIALVAIQALWLLLAVVGAFVVAVVKLPFRAVGWILGLRPAVTRVRAEPPLLGTLCPERRCRCGNPASARFCRRCGRVLPTPMS